MRRLSINGLSTPKPTPRVILKNAWHQQQQQGDSGSCRTLKRERHEGDDNRVKEVAGELQREQCWKRKGLVSSRSPSWSVTRRHPHGREADDQQVQTLVDKLQDEYRTNSMINDLEKNGTSNTFSEASRRTIKELGNIELNEFGDTFRTIQSPSCLRFSKAGTVYCLCGKCVLCRRLNKQKKFKDRIGIISNPLFIIIEFQSGECHEPKQWQYDHWKAKDAAVAVRKRNFPWNTDVSLIHSTKNRNRRTDGLLSAARTRITSQPSTWTMLLLGMKEIDTRTCSYCDFKTGKNQGNMSRRADFKLSARSSAVASHEQGKHNFYIPRGKQNFDSDH